MPETLDNFTDQDGFEPARVKILEVALRNAAFDGWNSAMADATARDAGIDPAVKKAAFPGGVRDLLRFWSLENDRAMREAMAGAGIPNAQNPRKSRLCGSCAT